MTLDFDAIDTILGPSFTYVARQTPIEDLTNTPAPPTRRPGSYYGTVPGPNGEPFWILIHPADDKEYVLEVRLDKRHHRGGGQVGQLHRFYSPDAVVSGLATAIANLTAVAADPSAITCGHKGCKLLLNVKEPRKGDSYSPFLRCEIGKMTSSSGEYETHPTTRNDAIVEYR